MRELTPTRYLVYLGVCTAVLALLLVLSPGIGSQADTFGWRDAWRARLGLPVDRNMLAGNPYVDLDRDGVISDAELTGFSEQARHIGFALRLPRSLLALQVGVTLALCGAVLQILFRNPLATPYTLGVASGGSLGAMIAIRLGWTAVFWGISSLTVAAFGGGLAVVGIVLALATGGRRLTSNELLLAGVTMGLFCSAMMMLVTAVSDERVTFEAVRWMMGSLDALSPAQSVSLMPFILPAWIVLILFARALNQLRFGRELAMARGVHVARAQALCVLVCTLAVAAVVARCGPIGFVGLVVPHITALLVGSDCRILLPATGLVGGAFLVLCDWASQVSMRLGGWVAGREIGSAVLPIGVITAIVGVPIFLTLLRTQRKGSGG